VDHPGAILDPLPYQLELRDYLKSEERELWNWFSSAQAHADYVATLRLELLKNTYRLDSTSHADLYQSVAEAKARLGLDIPVTLYQAQNNPHLNATLFYMANEAHIVFCGPVFTLLTTQEIKSVIGHELTHFHLWDRDHGEFHVMDRLLQAVASDPRAASSHEQTARRNQLYTEIFADRGSLRVVGDPNPVISGLVKIQTGLSQVSAESYLKQAEEIFTDGTVKTEGISHPETFIRARALTLWQQQGANASPEISQMIEGTASFDELDLLAQKRLTSTTRRFIEYLLRPKWFQTPATIAHAKLYFPDFRLNGGQPNFVDDLNLNDSKTCEYLCYVLLDFAKADPELDDLPIAAALQLSRLLEFDEHFEKLAAKELKMKIRDVRRIKKEATDMLTRAEAVA